MPEAAPVSFGRNIHWVLIHVLLAPCKQPQNPSGTVPNPGKSAASQEKPLGLAAAVARSTPGGDLPQLNTPRVISKLQLCSFSRGMGVVPGSKAALGSLSALGPSLQL